MTDDSPTRMDALVAFRTRNIMCFRDETAVSLEASRLANAEIVHHVRTASATPTKILPAAGVFGANGSGKSALLKAMKQMQSLVLHSFRGGLTGSGVPRKPFLLDAEPEQGSSEFAVDLIVGGVHWRYAFEFDNERVLQERAYHCPRGRAALVFERMEEDVSFGASFRKAGHAIIPLLRRNALLLSIFGAVNERRVEPLFAWWQRNFKLANAHNRPARAAFTAKLAKERECRSRVLGLIHAADPGLIDLKVVKLDPGTTERLEQTMRILSGDDETGEDPVKQDQIQLVHRGRNRSVPLAPSDESNGTQVWVSLAGPILDALVRGTVLLVDEIDASLHPDLVANLINLFQDPRNNPNCAQLVFNAHDTNILGNPESRGLGRDQIWFAEKDKNGAASLYSLADFRPRRGESIERRYLSGRYGGGPTLDPAQFADSVKSVNRLRSGLSR
ncbi:MAG: ATP-binding protein [Bryobacterales bacterium]|nr:ATP-binding protein [Bryobacterales bacterium]